MLLFIMVYRYSILHTVVESVHRSTWFAARIRTYSKTRASVRITAVPLEYNTGSIEKRSFSEPFFAIDAVISYFGLHAILSRWMPSEYLVATGTLV